MSPDEKQEGQQLTLAQHVESMLNSEGWKHVKEALDMRIIDLQSIANLDLTKPETVNIQIAARKMAVDEMFAWLKADVYGFIEQQKVAQEKLGETNEDPISRG